MKIRSSRRVVFSFHSVCLLFLSAAFALAITDLGTLPGGSGTQAGDAQNREQKPSFISNTLLVKLTPQARANLKAKGEDVDPAATGLPSLDAICRDHGVKGFGAIMASGAHRDAAAAINSWYKLTLAGSEQRLPLIEQSNDEELNLAYSGAEPLGRLMARLKQDTDVESVALDYVFDVTVIAFDRSGNGSLPSAGNYDIENAYATKVLTTHLCDPSRTGCTRDAWDATFTLTYPAIAKQRIEWFNSSFSSNYAGAVSGRVSDGHRIFSSGVFPRYWTGNVFEYDFGRPVFCGGCTANQIGAALGDIYLCLDKDCPITAGTAETDITVTITYPQ